MFCTSCGLASAVGARFCGGCGASLAAPADADIVRKTVTVLFVDLVGSTALGEQVDPESLRSVQTRYFDAARSALERHGGTVEKFIGDAVVGMFGVPEAHEDDALRACRAALEIQEETTRLNIPVRTGVNVRTLLPLMRVPTG